MKFSDQDTLKNFSQICSDKIRCAQDGKHYFRDPYQHIVIDNFFDNHFAAHILDHFPSSDDPSWEKTNDENIEVKQRSTWKSEFDIPQGIVSAIRILNSSPILESISSRLNIPKLIPDPYFTGGGLNVTLPGGVLDVHVDGNYHDATGLNRRVNAILYLNPSWSQGWGGEFGVYDPKGEECIKKIPPLFNRLVIFDTHDLSYHGLPEPLNFPQGESRKSIILYYYTKDPRPEHLVTVKQPHSALWKKKGMTDKRGNRTRDYK